jgi:hypothetical protein
MAATYEYGMGRVVYLNHLWIWYTDVYFKNDTDNGEILMENCLRYVHPGIISWLRVNPSTGRVGPGADSDVAVLFDAGALAPGDYSAVLSVYNNDPSDPQIIIPVDLEVSATSVEPVSRTPAEFALFPGYPNPFNASITIQYSLAEAGHVTLQITDLQGRIVAVLRDGETENAGVHRIVWNGTDSSGMPLSSGVYLVRLRTEKFTGLQKITLLK